MDATNTETVNCPGCGLKLPNQHVEFNSGYNASAECYQKYNELTSYTLTKQDMTFIHQHAADTYAAQHSGDRMKRITTAFALIGLYYAIERGYSGKQVQRVHTLLARKRHEWVPLEPPQTFFSLTVCDVLTQPPGEGRDDMLRKWMSDVWDCWRHQQDWVRAMCRTLLND